MTNGRDASTREPSDDATRESPTGAARASPGGAARDFPNGATRAYVDGVPLGHVSVRDRGLAYGDALFETMRVVGGRIALLALHLDRLETGFARLGFPAIDRAALVEETERLVADEADAVAKLIVTRGEGERGYAPRPDARPTRILTLSAAPASMSGPLTLAWCDTRLAEQPLLAGLKHANRLEQVLARREIEGKADEGLMLDASGRVIGATAANLFAVIDGELVTPAVERCGIAGVARRVVIEREGASVRDMLPEALARAGEVFLTNAVRGVMPVAAIGEHRYATDGPRTRAARRHFERG